MYKILHPSADPSFSVRHLSQTGYGTVQKILFHTKSWSPWVSQVFMCFPLLVILPFARQTLHLLIFDFLAFHSSGVSLFIGQWFLPVSLAMLWISFKSWCILKRKGAYILKKEKEIILPFLFLVQYVRSQCTLHNQLQKGLFLPFVWFSKYIQAVQMLINKIYTTHVVVVVNNTCWILYSIAICIHSILFFIAAPCDVLRTYTTLGCPLALSLFALYFTITMLLYL